MIYRLPSITIPADVKSIESDTFSGCSNLKTVEFASGSKLGSIGANAFYGSGLTNITIPAGVTSIGNSAFYKNGLTSITIPANVTSIGWDAFYECSNLGTVTFAEGSKLESIGENAFDNCGSLTSIVSGKSRVY